MICNWKFGDILSFNAHNWLYDNEYTSIIDIYFYEFFLLLWPRVITLQNIWDTLSDVLDKCSRFSFIKKEPVSIKPKPSCA
jgi:hypothetical protein